MPLINRTTKIQSLTIASGGNLTEAFDMRDFAGGNLYLPAAWTAANIAFKISTSEGGTFVPLYDADGTLVEVTGPAVDTANQLPTETFACVWVKLWSQDGAAANTNQAAARTLVIELKS